MSSFNLPLDGAMSKQGAEDYIRKNFVNKVKSTISLVIRFIIWGFYNVVYLYNLCLFLRPFVAWSTYVWLFEHLLYHSHRKEEKEYEKEERKRTTIFSFIKCLFFAVLCISISILSRD